MRKSRQRIRRFFAAMLAGAVMAASVPAVQAAAEEADNSVQTESTQEADPQPVLSVSFDQEDAADESGNGNAGTVVGNPEFTEGKRGKAVHLVNPENREDNARQYINFGQPENLLFGEGSFTVMLWYKADASSDTEGAIVGNKYWVTGANPGFTIGDMREGVTLNLNTPGCSRKDTGRYADATDGTWHHIAAVADRTETQTMTLYIDGIPVGSEDISSLTGGADAADFVVGASNKEDGTKFLAVDDAYIDELVVYREALSEQQVTDLGIRPEEKEDGEVLKVNFDDGDARDLSGNGNDGMVEGEPEFVSGVSGRAIHLVNSTDRNEEARQYVNFGQPETLQFGEGSFSVMFLYKADAAVTTEGAVIGNKYWVTGANPGFTIGDMREGITLNLNTPGCSRIDTGRYSSATDNDWHHVAAVIDRTERDTMTLYIDGIPVEKQEISSLVGSADAADFVLGASNKEDGTKFLALADASIDELSVRSYAMEGYEIRETMRGYACQMKLGEMEEQVSLMPTGERYTQEAVLEMQRKIEAAGEAMRQDGADKEALYERIEAEYENFLEGAPTDMSFHLISDTHVTSSFSEEPAVYWAEALQDMKEANPEAQALVTAGDNTQDGCSEEMEVFYSILEKYNPVKPEQTMIALGNHDMRGPDSSVWETDPQEPNAYWETIYGLYMEYNQNYMPDTDGRVYYDRWIGGYHFLVLNSENSAKDTAWLTDAQLQWLKEKLQEGEAGQPAFIIVHQALNDTHTGSNNYLGFGAQDGAVKELLTKYSNAVFLSGHIHNGLGTAEVMEREYGTLVDVPSFRYNHNGITGAGTGYEAYIYDTELYLRARDFVNHEWLPQYDVSIRLPSLPSLYRQVSSLEEQDYTEESWQAASAAFAELMPQAETMLSLECGNYGCQMRDEINRLETDIKAALNSLEKTESESADKTGLNLVIAMAEKLEAEQAQTGCYTEETWTAVQTALDATRTLAADENASQEDVDNAFLELITAVNLLENAVQRVALQTAIEGAKAILADEEALLDYTPESVENLRKVLAEAENVYALEGADQETVNAAARNLMDAVTSLVVIDKETRLDILIQKAEEMMADADQYTAASVENLQAALDAARLIAEDKDASEEAVNAAYLDLAEAMTSMVRRADKSELKTALDKAAEILADTSKYVEESVAGLQAAADAAQAVYDREDADASEVGAAVKSLVDEILKARLMGDVDGNGTVDSADSAEVLEAAAEAQDLDEMQSLAADVNGDGAADSNDAAEILSYAAEQKDLF